MFLFGEVFLMGNEFDSFWMLLLTSDIRDCCLEIWLDDVSFLS